MNNDPRIITLRRSAACGCGVKLERGTAAVWYPLDRKGELIARIEALEKKEVRPWWKRWRLKK